MNVQFQPHFRTAERRLPFECVALVLQGGGALGAYQAESTRLLRRQISIPTGSPASQLAPSTQPSSRETSRPSGSRSCAPSGRRSPPTRCSTGLPPATPSLRKATCRGRSSISLVRPTRSLRAPPAFSRFGSPLRGCTWMALLKPRALRNQHLKSTLERLVDFDRINAGEMRFSVGAVNVRTGNFVYFDNEKHTIRPEHVMASGSLPPGFPAVEIEGELYWDGGLISNTPLQWVVEQGPRQDTLAFQVDLGARAASFLAIWPRS